MDPAALPGISVAMATYNGARFIGEQLASLAAQSHLPFELVVTDDGSTDETEALVQDFAREAPFPVLWHRNAGRLGYRVNFVRAAERCRGELVAFCDQDDLWRPGKLAAAAEAFADPSVLLYHHAAQVISAEGQSLGGLAKHRTPQRMTEAHQTDPWAFTQGFTQVIRRSLVGLSHLQAGSMDLHEADEPEAHDTLFFFLASTLGRSVFEPAVLADYRQHGRNAYGAGPGALGLLRRLRSRLEDRGALYGRLSRVAACRAGMLGEVAAGPVAPGWQADAALGAERWRVLAELYAARHALYSDGLGRRVSAMGRLLRGSAYGTGGEWSFTAKGLAKDAVLGLALAPVTSRFGFKGATADPTCRGRRERASA